MMPKLKISMSLLKLMLNITLLFGVTNLVTSKFSREQDHMNDIGRTYYNLMPMNYNIRLKFPENFQEQAKVDNITFSGHCEINFYLHEATQDIDIDAQQPYLTIQSAYISDASVMKIPLYRMTRQTYDSLNYKVNLEFHEVIPPGTYELIIDFHGLGHDDAIFRNISRNRSDEKFVFATYLRPTEGKKLFPCFNHPELKSTFNIAIKSHPKFMMLSNMPQLQRPLSVDNMIWITFQKTPSMYAHEVVIVIFTNNSFSHSTMWHRDSVPMSFVNKVATTVTRTLEVRWERFRNLTDANLFVFPGFPDDAMMKSGLNIFREEAILYEASKDRAQFSKQMHVTNLIARVVAFDRLRNFGSSSWPYLWLNEGIAMLLGHAVIQENYPQYRIKELFVVQTQQECLRFNNLTLMDGLTTVGRTPELKEIKPLFRYIKGPVLLHMMQHVLQVDNVFWKGLDNYLNYTVTNIFDFCAAMQAARNEFQSTYLQPNNIGDVMDSWTSYGSFPVLSVKKKELKFLRLQVENYDIMKSHYLYIPLAITKERALQFTHYFTWEYRGGTPTGVRISPSIDFPYEFGGDDWVIVNMNQIGFYRVNYEAENWRKIARYLNSSDYLKIPLLNRAQIIDDAFYFLMNNELDLSIFFDLSKYLSQEKDYVVWFPMLKIFESISGFIPYESSQYIKQKMEIILRDTFRSLHYNEDYVERDFTNSLRRELAKWECIFGSSNCTEYIYVNTERTYASPDIFSISFFESLSPPWKEWVYCKGLMGAEYGTWEKLFQMYLQDTSSRLLKYLICSENPDTIQQYINNFAKNKQIINRVRHKGKKDSINIFHSIITRHSKNTLTLESILENFLRLIPREIHRMVAMTTVINHVYTPIQITKIQEFLERFVRDEKNLLAANVLRRLEQIDKQKTSFRKLIPEF